MPEPYASFRSPGRIAPDRRLVNPRATAIANQFWSATRAALTACRSPLKLGQRVLESRPELDVVHDSFGRDPSPPKPLVPGAPTTSGARGAPRRARGLQV